MLDNYLEKNVQNKLSLLNALRFNSSINAAELFSFFPLSMTGFNTLIEELKEDIKPFATIEKRLSCFSVTIHKNYSFLQLLHAVYRNSSVLHCLKFMLMNDHNLPFSTFLDSEYLTKSTAYRIRQNCISYLDSIGLHIDKNRIVGEEYRIRFLIALLHYKYGINCYEEDSESVNLARNFILSTNPMIDRLFLDITTNEYGYFEYLLILSWKRKKYLNAPISSPHFDKAKQLPFYNKIIQAVKAEIEPALDISFTQDDHDYIYLAYCCTNNCVFADQWTQENIDQLYFLAFSDAVYKDLHCRLIEHFGEKVGNSHQLKSTLIYFFKKCFMELYCIIPDKNFYLESRKKYSVLTVVSDVAKIIDEWKNANHLKYTINQNHIFYLSLQIELIIRQFIEPVPVFVLSDLSAELEITTLHLLRVFTAQKATITPILINTVSRESLYSCRNSVIVYSKKFRYIIEDYGLSENNTVIPVSVELNNTELLTIQRAITERETENFLKFINHV